MFLKLTETETASYKFSENHKNHCNWVTRTEIMSVLYIQCIDKYMYNYIHAYIHVQCHVALKMHDCTN